MKEMSSEDKKTKHLLSSACLLWSENKYYFSVVLCIDLIPQKTEKNAECDYRLDRTITNWKKKNH